MRTLVRKLLCRVRGTQYIDVHSFGRVGTGTVIKPGFFERPERIFVGDYCYVGQGAFWSGLGGIHLADNVIIGPRVTLYTQNHRYKSEVCLPFGPPYEDVALPINIEESVWICLGAMILPGVTIHEGAVVAMGAVVVRDVPARAVVGGNPAEVISERSADVYERLKREKKYIMKFNANV